MRRTVGLSTTCYLLCSLILLGWRAVEKKTPTRLELSVESVEVAKKFPAYVGGGANIDPPDTVGGGDGIPMISIGGGSSFLAGEVGAKDDTTSLIKITIIVANSTSAPASFKIGDVRLGAGSEKWTDFAAVGYGYKLCAMGDLDRKKVKAIVVTIPPSEMRRLSFAFPLLKSDAKDGQVGLGTSPPVRFDIMTKYPGPQLR
jgi:hypothetical protein